MNYVGGEYRQSLKCCDSITAYKKLTREKQI